MVKILFCILDRKKVSSARKFGAKRNSPLSTEADDLLDQGDHSGNRANR